ncbi:MAG: M14 family metallopeptidase [Caldilineaceae bacterium]
MLFLLLAGCVPVSVPAARTTSGQADVPGAPGPQVRQFAIGQSVGGLPIEVYRFGHGPARLVLIGGIHGGYEWNTILLAYAVVDHYRTHAAEIPALITLDVVPVANPDGQLLAIGKTGRFTPADATAAPADTIDGRFNGNGVDLNRNWDCHWAPTAYWRSRQVSGGATPFSEAETAAMRRFLLAPLPDGVIFWHSAAGGVFAGGCDTRFAGADLLAAAFARGSGYPFRTSFDSYRVTGDAADWLSLQGIPAIAVELYNHEEIDLAQNLGGVEAVLAYLSASR